MQTQHWTQQWSLQRVIEAHPGCSGGSVSVHFDHDGRRIATSMYSGNEESSWKVWEVASGLQSLILTPHHTCITGELIRVFHPRNYWACSVIFSHIDPDVLYAASYFQTVRLSLADGSVAEFSGYQGNHHCFGDAMALGDDGTILYVGYCSAQCVVAYDVATLQLMWSADFEGCVGSIAYHDGMIYVTAKNAPVTMLSAEDGSVVRTLGVIENTAWGISVFAGLAFIMLLGTLLLK